MTTINANIRTQNTEANEQAVSATPLAVPATKHEDENDEDGEDSENVDAKRIRTHSALAKLGLVWVYAQTFERKALAVEKDNADGNGNVSIDSTAVRVALLNALTESNRDKSEAAGVKVKGTRLSVRRKTPDGKTYGTVLATANVEGLKGADVVVFGLPHIGKGCAIVTIKANPESRRPVRYMTGPLAELCMSKCAALKPETAKTSSSDAKPVDIADALANLGLD